MRNLIIDNHVIDSPIEDILKQLKKELTNGKLKHIEKKQDNFRVTCPTHKNGLESHPSCQIYCGDDKDIEYGTMHCFTCGESGPLWHFIGQCFDRSDEFGKEWLLERFGNTFVEKELNLTSIDLNKNIKEDYLDESILNEFQSYHPYMTYRKLTKKVIEKFKIKYDPKCESIVFPVWDEYNKLYMLTKRSVKSKYFYIDENKEKPVYLYNIIKKNNIKEVTVCESQINCLTLWGYGIPSIALFGTGTSYQYDILNRSGIIHYYLALDGDFAGKKGIKRFIKNIRKDVFIDVIIMPKSKDVNDLTEEEFNKLEIISSDEWLRRNN